MENFHQIGDKDRVRQFMLMILQIARIYVDGYTSVLVMYELLEMQKKDSNKYISNRFFLDFLYGISYQSAIINLSNIIIRNRDSINIHYLIKFFENHLIKTTEHEDIKKQYQNLVSFINLYPESNDLYKTIKEYRDQFIAHIDKQKFLSETGPSKRISLDELQQAYYRIGSLMENLMSSYSIDPELANYEQLLYISPSLRNILSKL